MNLFSRVLIKYYDKIYKNSLSNRYLEPWVFLKISAPPPNINVAVNPNH